MLLQAVIGLQDLDRLAQTAAALADFAAQVADASAYPSRATIWQILTDMPMRSVAERLDAALRE